MRELIANAPLHNSPGKCGLLESNCRGGAEQSAEEVEELHLERDLLEVPTRRAACKVSDELHYFNIFYSDGIAALGPLRLTMRRRRQREHPSNTRWLDEVLGCKIVGLNGR